MSPLVQSLLALAAILTVATASNCAEKDIGTPTNNKVRLATVSVPCPEGYVEVRGYCGDTGIHVGEHVEACNPGYGPAPTIEVAEGTLSPVHIICNDPYETSAIVKIDEYCLPSFILRG